MSGPNLKQIEKDSMDLVSQVNRIRIRSIAEYERVAFFLKSVKGMQKKVREAFDPIIESARATWKKSISQRDEHLNPLINAEKAVKLELQRYDDEQTAIRKKKEEEAAAAARAEEERKRREKERQAREWEAKEEAKRKEAARLRKKGEDEEAARLNAQADKAAEKAEERREEAASIHVPVPIVRKKEAKVDNLSFQHRWDYRIVDANKIPRKYMIPNETEIRKLVVAGGGKWKCAGIEIYQQKITASGC